MILYGAHLAQSAQALVELQSLAAALGATLHGLHREANAQGARDMGCGPHGKGLTGAQILAAAAEGKLKALYLVGVDPLVDAGADKALIAEALANLELLVVQDASPSNASKLATVLLPGFSFAEAEGTYTNIERRVQRLRPALTPGGHMRAGWQIIAEIAAEVGGPGWGYKTAADVFAEIARVVPSYAGLTFSNLSGAGQRVEGRE